MQQQSKLHRYVNKQLTSKANQNLASGFVHSKIAICSLFRAIKRFSTHTSLTNSKRLDRKMGFLIDNFAVQYYAQQQKI